MKPSKIFDVMDLALKARQMGEIFNPLFVGPPGVGKTEIVQQWCKARNLKSITLTSATLEAPDMRGYPMIELVNGKQRMITAVPDFWPTEGEGVIIAEELNRGTTSVMNCWMALTDKRRGFDNYTLPEGWIVVGCINPDGTDGGSLYDTNTMDPAIKDRFQTFNIEFDKTSFVQYMKENEWNKEVSTFVESGVWNYVSPENVKNTPGSKYIAPRTLSALNAVMRAGISRDEETQMMFFTTILGSNVGKDFYHFLHNESPVFYNDLVNNLKGSLSKLKKFSDPSNFKNGMIVMTVNDILETNTIDDKLLAEVLKVIPVDQGKVLIRDLEFKRNDKEILKRLCKNYPEFKEYTKAVINFGK